MPLITSTTNLNKLKFGIGNAGDRFDNGSSNQPYITTPIPGVNMDNSNPTPITELDSSGAPIYGDVTPGSLDILFRGGLNAVTDSITDVSRLTKMFFDTKSPNGLIFIGNQNLLSRTSVMTEASYGIGYGRNTEPNFIDGTGGGALPGGIYLPSSTLAQAAVNFSGTHLNLMGLDPTSPNSRTGETSGISSLFGGTGPGGGLRTYSMVMNDKIQNDKEDGAELSNRLVRIFDSKQNTANKDSDVIVYQGGPGSILGIGKTRIRFAGSNDTGDTRTGLNNALTSDNLDYFEGTDPTYFEKYKYTTLPSGQQAYAINNLSDKQGLSFIYQVPGANQNLSTNQTNVFNMNMLGATYTLASSFGSETADGARSVYAIGGANNSSNTAVWNAARLAGITSFKIRSSLAGNILPDFRKVLIDTLGPGNVPLTVENADTSAQRNILSLSPSYIDKNRTRRVEMGDAGSISEPKTRTNTGVKDSGRLNYGLAASDMVAIDKINAQTMYVASGPRTDLAINDFVKFRIAAIDNAPDANGNAVYMHFRAFLDSFSDSYTASWNPTKFSGRGDNLYTYSGFGRTISLSFTVYAQSKAELIPMYKKLNYLASTMAPDYNTAGFMQGNLVRLTLGGYLYEQPGFISAFTYEAPQESSWEIAIDAEGGSDSSVKELPFMIKVTGMSFTPIQDFLPRKVKPSAANGMNEEQIIEERYIALANKTGDSLYRDEYIEQMPFNTDDTQDSELNSNEEDAQTTNEDDVDLAAVNNGSNSANIQNVTSATSVTTAIEGGSQTVTNFATDDGNGNTTSGVQTQRQQATTSKTELGQALLARLREASERAKERIRNR